MFALSTHIVMVAAVVMLVAGAGADIVIIVNAAITLVITSCLGIGQLRRPDMP